jgi:hypothetical protein
MSERGKCRSCNADVLWVESDGGWRLPLNAEPENRYVLEFGSGHTSIEQARVRATYVSHVLTCPHAERWRKT